MSIELVTLGSMLPALAQTAAVETLQAPPGASPGTVSPEDFSTLNLFLKATLTVQIVAIVLVVASVWCWAIVINKALQFRRVRNDVASFEDTFWSGISLEELHERVGRDPASPIERVFSAGMVEWNRSVVPGSGILPGTQARVERAMGVAITREGQSLSNRLGFLATTGAVAPFVGLFGTVWGIKHSFESIAAMQNTNLAVVAPGIAEALFVTALGLLAAIPAVVAYNRLGADVERLLGDLEAFADEFATILGRQIDRASMPQRMAEAG